jgi:AcrR family transcriptional regulator
VDDIARRAGVSRPLVYLKFKNKEELFTGVFEYLTEGRPERAMAVINGKGSPRERLLSAFEIMLVEPWTKVIGHPMSADFYEVCSLHLPQVTTAYARNSIKCAEAVLGDRDVAEVFFFATEGLHSDLPSAKVLLKRLRILVNQFAEE